MMSGFINYFKRTNVTPILAEAMVRFFLLYQGYVLSKMEKYVVRYQLLLLVAGTLTTWLFIEFYVDLTEKLNKKRVWLLSKESNKLQALFTECYSNSVLTPSLLLCVVSGFAGSTASERDIFRLSSVRFKIVSNALQKSVTIRSAQKLGQKQAISF